jgi:enterochelin esterase-like enzyme
VIGRRSFLAALALSGCSDCSREGAASSSSSTAKTPATEVPPPVPPTVTPAIVEAGTGPRGKVGMDTWTFDGNGRAVVLTPGWVPGGEKLPVLFALHGRGEANKGPVEGVMGWPRDYALLRAIERVCAPPLTSDDLEGFVDPKRLADHNSALAKDAFKGLVVVCPYSPDVDLRKPPQIKEYADYMMKVVLPRVKKELPVLGTPQSIGIDGVSLGGALALRIGLNNADAFGALGTLQPAIGEDQVPEYTDLAKAARAKNADLKLRLLTSTKDYFKGAIRATSESWKNAGIAHDFAEVPGPHDYPFNRGPGAIEMLLWHDRILART